MYKMYIHNKIKMKNYIKSLDFNLERKKKNVEEIMPMKFRILSIFVSFAGRILRYLDTLDNFILSL